MGHFGDYRANQFIKQLKLNRLYAKKEQLCVTNILLIIKTFFSFKQ